MATVKFHTKNVTLFCNTQVTDDVAVNPTATDVIAALEAKSTVSRETEAFEYTGDSLSRDELTTVKDTTAEVTIQAIMPALGVLDNTLTAPNAPLYKWLRACGADVNVDSNGVVTYDNKTPVTDAITLDYRKSSPEATGGKDKLYRAMACRGQVDVSLASGTRTKLNFKFMGNDVNPTMENALTPDYLQQKSDISSVVRLSTMQLAIISEIAVEQTATAITSIVGSAGTVTVTATAHGYVGKEHVTQTGTTLFNGDFYITYIDANTYSYSSSVVGSESSGSTIKRLEPAATMCIQTFEAPNFFGFDYNRYQLTCQEGFSKVASPTDVTANFLEDEVGGDDFDPEANIEKFFEVEFKYGTGDGNYVGIVMDRLQLVNVDDSDIAGYFGKSAKFRNAGKSTLILS